MSGRQKIPCFCLDRTALIIKWFEVEHEKEDDIPKRKEKVECVWL
jgi:hypothetical protein